MTGQVRRGLLDTSTVINPRRCARAGRKPRARAYDALIAAVALANDLPVHTCNPGDFAGIDGLRVVEVPVPGA